MRHLQIKKTRAPRLLKKKTVLDTLTLNNSSLVLNKKNDNNRPIKLLKLFETKFEILNPIKPNSQFEGQEREVVNQMER